MSMRLQYNQTNIKTHLDDYKKSSNKKVYKSRHHIFSYFCKSFSHHKLAKEKITKIKQTFKDSRKLETF